MVFATPFQEFVNDDALVDDVDAKVACSQDIAIEFKRARIDDDGCAAFRLKIPFQDFELTGGRNAIPIHDSDLRRHFHAAPFAVSAEQRRQQKAMRLGQPAMMLPEKPFHRRYLEENFLELPFIPHTRLVLCNLHTALEYGAAQITVKTTAY